MKILILVAAFVCMSLDWLPAQVDAKVEDVLSARIRTLCAGRYNRLYERAISDGELDLRDEGIPAVIRSNERFCEFYRAGYIRALRSYLTADGLKKGEGLGIHENLYRDEFQWELEGFLAGCKSAHAVGDRIMSNIKKKVTELYSKTLSLDATITELEKGFAEHAAHGQPATRPLSK